MMRPRSTPALFAFLFVTGALLQAQQPGAALKSPSQTTIPGASNLQTEPEENESAPEPSVTTAIPTPNSQIKAALAVLTNVLDQYRRSGDRIGEAGTLSAIANSYNALGQQQRAIEQFQLALAIFRESNGHVEDEARTLSHIGDVYREWGFPEQSVRFYRDSLAIYAHINDTVGKSVALNNLGVAYLSLRDKKKSVDYLNRALASYRASGDRHAVALTLNNLGMAYNMLANDSQRALDYFQQSMTELQLIDDRDSQGIVLDNIGALCIKLGQKEMAEVSFDRALQLFRRTGDTEGQARVQKHLRMLNESATVASKPPNPSAD